MQTLARNGYTAEQVRAALHGAAPRFTYRYELLDANNQHKADLTTVREATVRYDALADVKRGATFTLTDDGSIDYLRDRIRPYVRLAMPDGGYVEWPQGVFLLTTPPRDVTEAGEVTRQIEAYDQLQVLIDTTTDDRYTVAAGTNYIAAVAALLTAAGVSTQNLTPTSLTLPATRDWEPGTTYLQIVNDLLQAINYRSLWFDELGWAIAQPYVSPADRAAEYIYRDDGLSVMFRAKRATLDLWRVPNKWVAVVSQPDRPVLRSVYVNSNPASPTSTVSRGRTICAPIESVDVPDQATLDAYVARRAYEDSQVYEHVTWYSGPMPIHSDSDVYILEDSKLGMSAKFVETSWELPLVAGGRMRHEARRVVTV